MGDRDKSRMESRYSRDLLNRFMGSGEMGGAFDAAEGEEDVAVELNLGLSLGGRFGVDKSSANNLMRSSSVATYLPVVRADEAVTAAAPPPVAYSALTRTASLPVETEEEWRKRKELQTLRRMEAKRRRSEKQRGLRAEREGGGGGGGGGGSGGGRWGEEEKREGEVSLKRRSDKDQFMAASKRFVPPLGMPVFGNAGQGQSSFGSEVEPAAAVAGRGRRQPGSQGSVVESHGGSSSSEMESRPLQGSSSCGELSPVSIKSLREASNEDVGSPGSKIRENAIACLRISTTSSRTSTVETGNASRPPQPEAAKNQNKETGKTSLEEMPCVFTKGDGPNGRRVDGILYKYGRGEEVRIMCVCHGTFFSPVEFVKHAGGTDVSHPLKHIVVNPNASPFE